VSKICRAMTQSGPSSAVAGSSEVGIDGSPTRRTLPCAPAVAVSASTTVAAIARRAKALHMTVLYDGTPAARDASDVRRHG
jgi:hypothetical protein